MEWPVVLALILVVPLILFPAVLIWSINLRGIRDMAKERRSAVVELIKKRGRMAAATLIPLAIYAVLVWYFSTNYSWQVALAVALVLPIVLFVPVIVWAAVASGLADVMRDRVRRRALASRRRVAPAAAAAVEEKR